MEEKRARSSVFQPNRPSPLTQSSTMNVEDLDQVQLEAYYLQLRGLNHSVQEQMTQTIDKNPFADLSAFRNEYSKYLKSIREQHKDVFELNKESDDRNNDTTTTVSSQLNSNADSTPKTSQSTSQPTSQPTSTTGVSTQPFSAIKFPAFAPSSNTFGTTAAAKTETSDKKEETASKPAFSFGTTTNATTTTTTTESSKESAEKPAFSFGAFNKTGFSFNTPSSSTTGSGLAFAAKKEADNSQKDNQETENADGADSDEDTPKEEATPLDDRVGEENEDTLYSTRSKIYHDTKDGYEDKGVGVLRLNREKDNPSISRIICRIDGTGGILLNARIYKGMPVDVIGKMKKDVQTLVSLDGKMTKILLRVKDGATATALEEKLKELVANCS